MENKALGGERVLLVEDDALEAERLRLDLTQDGFRVAEVVDTATGAIEAVRLRPPDILIVDVVLAGSMNGIQAVEHIRDFSDVPVIYLTAHDAETFLVQAERTRPVAYLLKPYRRRELSFQVRMGLARRDVERRLLEAKEKAEAELWHLATHDALTQLPNRTLLLDRLGQAIHLAYRHAQQFAVIFVDLDHFKRINDGLGHAVGDKVLRTMARRMLDILRDEDTVGRLGGDEFVLILKLDGQHLEYAMGVLVEKLKSAITEPLTIDGQELCLTASCGLCVYPQDGEDAETLLRNADTAMYRAKHGGRNSYRFYSSEMTAHAQERLRLEADFRHAMESGQLELQYQPQQILSGQDRPGIEALLRWRHPERGLLLPEHFLGLAEEMGLINMLDEWVFQQACRQMRQWIERDLPIDRLAVNLTGDHLIDKGLQESMLWALEASGCPPNRLEIEVTERHIMCDPEASRETLNSYRKMGFAIAMDDFGTGYSSMSHLKILPLTRLKIDQTFVRGVPDDREDVAITGAIIDLGQRLGLKVVAEGVESQAQLDFLRQQGCDAVQGYLCCRPLPSEKIPAFLEDCLDPAGSFRHAAQTP